MGARLAAHDWTAASVGPVSQWQQSLRTAVNIILSSKQPMFLAWGDDLTFIYNDAYAPILGERHPGSIGRPFHEVWPDIWNDIQPLIKRALSGEATWADNLHLVMERNGYPEDTWYSFSYSPLRNDADAISGMFCSCVETTSQVLAERQSMAERERLFAMTRDLFGVATFSGAFKALNPAWARALGRPHDELLARPFHEIVHPDDLAQTADVVARLQRGEPVHQFFVRLLKADGEPLSFAWSAFPDETAGSDIFYTVGRDITDDLRREQALRQSQKMEAIGQLTGGIAHDFNNLLQAVHGNLDLIRRKPQDPERVARLAANGLLASERGAKLTAQLLAFSRAQKLELRPTALAPLITGMKEMLAHSIGPSVQIKVEPIPADVRVLIDPTQLEMAVMNLAINARDAMPQGGDLTIAVEETKPDGEVDGIDASSVVIRVSDTGTGMTPEVAARAFDPFFSTKATGQGTGLGLSQVYGMITQAGGSAWIEPVEPHGTSIVLSLKAAPAETKSAGAASVADLRKSADNRRVLVIDDDPDVRAILGDFLDALGATVFMAADGIQGLACLDEAAPDVLILDFAMPGMNGAEVAEKVRSRRPGLPIVFASGYSDTAAIEASVGRSATFLRKPFDIVDLEAALEASKRPASE